MHSKQIELIYCLPLLCCFIVQLKLAKGEFRTAGLECRYVWHPSTKLISEALSSALLNHWNCRKRIEDDLVVCCCSSPCHKPLKTCSQSVVSWGHSLLQAGMLRCSQDASPLRPSYKALLAACVKSCI